jgi:hypothetical protein
VNFIFIVRSAPDKHTLKNVTLINRVIIRDNILTCDYFGKKTKESRKILGASIATRRLRIKKG